MIPLIYGDRGIDLVFGTLKFHRRLRIYFGVCVVVVYRHVSICWIKVLFAPLIVLAAIPPMKDILHIFFDCPFSIQVWNRTGLWGFMQHALSNIASATNVIVSLLENLSAELSQCLSTIIWSIWKHRNLRVWDDATETSVDVVERARNMVADWQFVNALDILASTSPPQNTVVVNTGASTIIESCGSLLHQVDTNVISTQLFLLTSIVQVLAFVYVTRKVLLS